MRPRLNLLWHLPGCARLRLSRVPHLLGLLWMALFLDVCPSPVWAEWPITATAYGYRRTWGERNDPNPLTIPNDFTVYEPPPQSIAEDLLVFYSIDWSGGGPPKGVHNNTMKVKVRVVGGVQVQAQRFDEDGITSASATIWTDVGGPASTPYPPKRITTIVVSSLDGESPRQAHTL